MPEAAAAVAGVQQAQPEATQPAGYTGPSDPNLGPAPPPNNIATGPVLAEEHWPLPNVCPAPLAGGGHLTDDGYPTGGGSAGGGYPAEGTCLGHWEAEFQAGAHRVCNDYCNFYSFPSLAELLVGTGVAATMANTNIDTDFRHWYQCDVRSPDTNHFSDVWMPTGNGRYVIPVMGTLALADKVLPNEPWLEPVSDFGDRTTRACLVGAPPLLLMQELTGGARPSDVGRPSEWRPFQDDHGLSGHAFIGAVPFITAADMSDNVWAKYDLYFCSTLTGVCRINNDRHYLSQVCLGWWMGYLSCQAVTASERTNTHILVTPLASPEMTGLGAVCQR